MTAAPRSRTCAPDMRMSPGGLHPRLRESAMAPWQCVPSPQFRSCRSVPVVPREFEELVPDANGAGG